MSVNKILGLVYIAPWPIFPITNSNTLSLLARRASFKFSQIPYRDVWGHGQYLTLVNLFLKEAGEGLNEPNLLFEEITFSNLLLLNPPLPYAYVTFFMNEQYEI